MERTPLVFPSALLPQEVTDLTAGCTRPSPLRGARRKSLTCGGGARRLRLLSRWCCCAGRRAIMRPLLGHTSWSGILWGIWRFSPKIWAWKAPTSPS